MKRTTKIIIAVGILISLAALWAAMRPSPNPPVREKTASKEKENADEYEFLKALPYVQWSDTKGDQQERGVTLHEPSRAYQGYNIYTNDEDEVYLTDMTGKRVNTWHLPGKNNCEYAELLEDGSLIAVCANQAVVKVDWNSQTVWEHKLRIHHDIEVLPDGSYLTLLRQSSRYKQQKVVFDSIIHVSPQGDLLQRWNTADKREEIAKFHPPHPMEVAGGEKIQRRWKKAARIDYYHMNTVQLLPETPLGKKDSRFRAGNLVVCFRNVNLIAILDRQSMKIVWTWGPGQVELPHMPTMLPDGNILIYDNGTHREYSRIIEIEPVTGRIVWEYKGNPPNSFFSHWQGSAQRLPNGNTLICESTKAVVFEVTKEGKMVWKFWSPEVRNTRRKRIYRFMRLSPEYVESVLARVKKT